LRAVAIPVVIMTARKAIDLLPAPSRDVLHKPFDGAKLLSTIARYATS
jgi:DNA-binding response OmpR family regulator